MILIVDIKIWVSAFDDNSMGNLDLDRRAYGKDYIFLLNLCGEVRYRDSKSRDTSIGARSGGLSC